MGTPSSHAFLIYHDDCGTTIRCHRVPASQIRMPPAGKEPKSSSQTQPTKQEDSAQIETPPATRTTVLRSASDATVPSPVLGSGSLISSGFLG